MAIGIHVVRCSNFTVKADGTRIDKSDRNGPSINDMTSTRMEALVIPDSSVPSSANYPTIAAYLALEAAAGYVLKHLDQSFIITYDQAAINDA
jgi:hypothetical protein